jgi:hypothetical protein
LPEYSLKYSGEARSCAVSSSLTDFEGDFECYGDITTVMFIVSCRASRQFPY